MTTVDCVLLKDKNLIFVAGLGPEISFEPVSEYYKVHAKLPNAGHAHSIVSFFYVLLRDPQGWLRSYKRFVSSYSSMSRDSVHTHYMPGRSIIRCLLALSYK